ncbi:MAG: small basic protein [Pirellulales bacterium]|nr:small basic protein [Pirellulales bacterium]
MTLDKSLKVRRGSVKSRNVLTRGERLQRLKAADRWNDGDDPFGLPKVRVYKLTMKKKKKKKEEEEGAEGAAAAATPAAAAAPAAKGATAKGAAAKGAKK